MSCPRCATELEDYSPLEGGWCPLCEEWWPEDVLRDYLEENED